MARPKSPPVDRLKGAVERFNKEHPIIGERYYVIEVTPGYNTGGYYDQDVPEKRRRVSPYFDNWGQADEWIKDFEPEKGSAFQIVKQFKRRTVIERWW